MRRRPLRVGIFVLLALVLALAVNAVVVDRETKPARADVGRIVALPGGSLQVREDGPAAAPPLVLLHGFTGSLHDWDPDVTALSRSHRLIRIDMLGHGGSAKPRNGYSMEQQADRVALVLERLKVVRALVAGHSMGGTVATALASRHPSLVRALVLVDTPPRNSFAHLPLTARLGLLPLLGQAIYQLVPDSQVRKALEKGFAPGFKVPDRWVRDYRRMTFSSYKSSARLSGRYLDHRALDKRIATTGLPLLVIFGARDKIVQPRAAQAFRDVPGARIEMIAGSGHAPMWERPAQTSTLILSFEASLTRGRPTGHI